MPANENRNSIDTMRREYGNSSVKLVQKQCLKRKYKARRGENLVYIIDIIGVKRFAQKSVNM